MRAALESFFSLPSQEEKVAILGEMRELGSASRASHAEIVELLREHPDVGVVLVGKEWGGLEGDYPRFDSSEACMDSLQSYVPNGALVLLKGSRGVELEKLLEIL
jgi:UDP-N-acetylmuramoyl-tripeptide--D-alanyl-D-alanine ligase